MKQILLSLIIILTTANVYSQDSNTADKKYRLLTNNLPENSICIGYHFLLASAIYEKVLPAGDKSALLIGGGILQEVAFGTYTNLTVKLGLIVGRSKHFFEFDIFLTPPDDHIGVIVPTLGYRYQSHKGFFVKADLFMPGVSAGYGF
jgi:hypothetical protein